MNLELSGKIALITGSSAGIGLAIARQLQEEGCTIVLNGRDPARLSAAQASLSGSSQVVADARDPAACEVMIAEVLALHGRLDILVCNIGSGASVPPGQETPHEIQRVLDINLHATTNAVWAATDALVASKGNIICISSICGIEALGCPVPYAVAKAALQSYVLNSARAFGSWGVRINSIAPGNILFEGSVWDRKLKQDRAAVEAMLARDVSLGCLGTPTDVARMAAYLASPLAAFITGATYVVDGGQLRS